MKVLLLAAAILILSTSCMERERGDEVENVSLIQLIADPRSFDGRNVNVIGFLRLNFEETALYIHEVDYKYLITSNAIWLRIDLDKLNKEQLGLSGRYVLVEGRFDADLRGHLGLFSGALDKVTVLEPWPPSNVTSSPDRSQE